MTNLDCDAIKLSAPNWFSSHNKQQTVLRNQTNKQRPCWTNNHELEKVAWAHQICTTYYGSLNYLFKFPYKNICSLNFPLEKSVLAHFNLLLLVSAFSHHSPTANKLPGTENLSNFTVYLGLFYVSWMGASGNLPLASCFVSAPCVELSTGLRARNLILSTILMDTWKRVKSCANQTAIKLLRLWISQARSPGETTEISFLPFLRQLSISGYFNANCCLNISRYRRSRSAIGFNRILFRIINFNTLDACLNKLTIDWHRTSFMSRALWIDRKTNQLSHGDSETGLSNT